MSELELIKHYETVAHDDELDFIYNQTPDDIDDIVFQENTDVLYMIKTYSRLLRKKIKVLIREQTHKDLITVLYLALDIPIELITEMRKHYPNYDMRVLIPIINIDKDFQADKKIFLELDGKQMVFEKTSISFEFFLQNRTQVAIVYKFLDKNSNITIYGIYSPIFSRAKSHIELSKLRYLAPFIKSARIAVKKLAKDDFPIDIVHCENIPYYLGGEFESNILSKAKVLQNVKDFTQIEMNKLEAFWAAINLADRKAMKKICRDEIIRKNLARLFNIHTSRRFYQMKDCLNFIYKNYYKFRKYVDKGDDIDENIIFNRLNARILKLFPNISQGENLYYNSMLYTLKKCNYWSVNSKTYYNEIFEKPELSGRMFHQIEKTKDKSDYIKIACDTKKYPKENTRLIYESFNIDNFRELRSKNKSAILKEFNSERIKTNFVDPTLFKGDDVRIYGSLDSFYNAPLIFVSVSSDIYANGVDILFNTVLKLFELHKNFQIIISINNGIKNSFIKNWVDFLSQNRYFNGHWVFIDGEVNLPKFYASADMTFIPRRINMATIEHFIAMNYGCVPIVSRVGILNDTIPDIFDDISDGCGFKTKKSLLTNDDNNELFMTPVLKALNLYQNNSNGWNLLIKNCMNKDFNWNLEILNRYDKIYQKML